MSLIPADGGLRRAGAHGWETIRYALDSNARTVRLCVILLTLGITSTVPFLIMAVVRGWLG
jgi:hypothetical protein